MLKLLVTLALIATTTALYSSKSNVFKLTEQNFNKYVIDSNEVWLVEFYAPWCGHCQKFVPEYSRTAKALAGVVRVGAINVEENRALGGKYGVTGFPTVKIFAKNKEKPLDYSDARVAEKLADAALKAVQIKVNAQLGKKSEKKEKKSDARDVIELTDNNFADMVLKSEEMWLVEFYAPWCGFCKKLAPTWSKVATELKGKILVGALDATANNFIATKYNINAYPTVKYFPPGQKIKSFEYDLKSSTQSDIVNWALEKLLEHTPAPEVVQIVDYVSFQDACETKSLCIISFLPHILDCQSDCRNAYLSLIKELSEKFKKFTWGWVWVEAGAQQDLESSLGVGGFGYPVMAVVNVNKMKFSVLQGSFSKAGIGEFLEKLSKGSGKTAPMDKDINIFSTEPWNGEDAEMPQVEENSTEEVEVVLEKENVMEKEVLLDKENVMEKEVSLEKEKVVEKEVLLEKEVLVDKVVKKEEL